MTLIKDDIVREKATGTQYRLKEEPVLLYTLIEATDGSDWWNYRTSLLEQDFKMVIPAVAERELPLQQFSLFEESAS